MDRARWVLGLGGISAAGVLAFPAVAAPRPAPAPAPTPTPTPCKLLSTPKPSPTPSSWRGSVVVIIPRTTCNTSRPVHPSPQPVGQAGVGAGQSGGGVGAGTGGGQVPFTGADLAPWLAAGLGLVGAGVVLVATGRRRSASA